MSFTSWLRQLKSFWSNPVRTARRSNQRRNRASARFLLECLEDRTVPSGMWSAGPPMITPVNAPVSAVMDGQLYVVGGGMAGGSGTAAVEAYNPANGVWTPKAPDILTRNQAAGAAINGKLYVAGGYFASSDSATNQLTVYDPTSNSWMFLPSQGPARAGMAFAAIGDSLYMTGGTAGYWTGDIATLEIYNTASQTWSTGAPMPSHRTDAGAVAWGGKMYVFGGYSNPNTPGGGTGNYVNTVDMYDPVANTWTSEAPMPTGVSRVAVTVLNDKIYVIGGWTTTEGVVVYNTVQVYDPAANTWTVDTPLPEPRAAATAATINGQIFVAGGYERYDGTNSDPSLRIFTPTQPPEPPSLVVTTDSDVSNAYDGAITLREAIGYANPGDTIQFDSSLAGKTINLASQIDINKNLTITGLGANSLAISGQDATRIFLVDPGTTVSISGLTIEHGKLPGLAGTGSEGGGIWNRGTLTVNDSIFTDNFTGGGGGAIMVGGGGGGATLTVNHCTFEDNFAGYAGGAIFSDYYSTINVTDSLFSQNVAGSDEYNSQYGATYGAGGAILINFLGQLNISSSTFSENAAFDAGGAIYSGEGTSVITNSTFSGNAVFGVQTIGLFPGGGAIRNTGVLTLLNSTIAGNTTQTDGGGIVTGTSWGSGVISSASMRNTIVAGNTLADGSTPSDISGTVSANYSLIGDATGATISGTGNIYAQPLLGSLADNGGPTPTRALLPGSRGINEGDPNTTGLPAYDQRGPGYDRVINGRVDIGAFEVQPAVSDTTPPTTTASPGGTQGPNGRYTTPVTMTLSATDPDDPSDALTTYYTIDGGSQQTYTGPFTIYANGPHTIAYFSKDPANNSEVSQSINFTIDTTPPVTTATPNGTQAGNGNYTTPVSITLRATDDDDPASTLVTTYSVDGGAPQSYTGAFTVSTNGSHFVSYFSMDPAGNTETPKTLAFVVAINHPPVANNFTVTLTNTSASINVLTHASDPDNDTLSIISVTQGTLGTVVINPNGTVTYTLTAVLAATDSFTYTVSDGHGGTATGTVTVLLQIPPSQQMNVVQTQVQNLTLPTGSKTALLNDLQNAEKMAAKGNNSGAAGQIHAFQVHVNNDLRRGQLDAATATLLLDEAQFLLQQLS